jgi:hypothetical protein
LAVAALFWIASAYGGAPDFAALNPGYDSCWLRLVLWRDQELDRRPLGMGARKAHDDREHHQKRKAYEAKIHAGPQARCRFVGSYQALLTGHDDVPLK